MTDYNYLKSAFTALGSGNVDCLILRRVVEAQIPAKPMVDGIRAVCPTNSPVDPMDCNYRFSFQDSLSAGEESTLGSIVAAHTGYTPEGPPYLTFRHQWDPNSGSTRYIPMDMSFSETSAPTDPSTRAFLPGKYALMRILSWNTGTTAPGTTEFGLHINDSTTKQAEVILDMASNNTPYTFNFYGLSNQTVEGEAVALSCNPISDPGGFMLAMSYWIRVD